MATLSPWPSPAGVSNPARGRHQPAAAMPGSQTGPVRPPPADQLLQRAQAHRRRRVLARPESHPGVDLDHRLAALEPVIHPRGPHHQCAADALHPEVLLPGVAPRCLPQLPHAPPFWR
jgi:hypothetical protein